MGVSVDRLSHLFPVHRRRQMGGCALGAVLAPGSRYEAAGGGSRVMLAPLALGKGRILEQAGTGEVPRV